MKKLVLLFAALLVAGCGEKSLSDSAIEKALEEAVELDSLQERNDLLYQVNKSEPYSGWVKEMYDSGQVQVLTQYKDGKEHGLVTEWHPNGQKKFQSVAKDGKAQGSYTEWHENGNKSSEGTYKDGKPDGLLTFWHENGQKKGEGTFKDGKIDGLFTEWHPNGQKEYEGTHKDGKELSAKYWNSKGEEVDSQEEAFE